MSDQPLEVMNPDDPKYSPLWLNLDISKPDADRVREWLAEHGVDVVKCAGFDFYHNINMIRCRMYRINEFGSPELDTQGNPIWDDPIEWVDDNPPPIVTSCHSLHRQY